MTNEQRDIRQWSRAIIIGGILLIGGVATIGGFIAINQIDRHLDGRDKFDAGLFLNQAQQMQFHLTEALQEGFAYLVSGDAIEKQEFLEWADAFPNEFAQLGRIAQHSRLDKQTQVLLKVVADDQQELVAAAQALFVSFEQNGMVDNNAFRSYEEIIDRTIQHTQDLIGVGQENVQTDRARFVRILEAAENIVLSSSILAALIAVLLAIFLLRVLARERAAREAAEVVRNISEQNFLDHYNHAPDMHVSVEAGSLKIVECNKTIIQVLGYSKSQIIGRPVLELYDSGSIDQAKECLESFRETGHTAADHLQIVAATGELVDVSLRVTAVRDEHGRIIRTRSVWRDIRTQVAVEKALRSGEARYRSLVASAPVCIHEVDRDGDLMDMNAAGLAMVGQTDPAAISGTPYLDFVQPPDRDRIGRLMKRALNGESVEYEFKSASSPVREFQSSFVPILDEDGRIDRLMGVTQDLTSRRASERALRQKQKMEAVGQLAGGIAHDFNNLLTVVIGYCEELGRLVNTESREQQYVEQISLAATQAAMLTAQLLAFSRHEERTPQVVDINKIISNLEEMLSRLIGEDIMLQTQLDDNLGRIEVDPGQIQQILFNLAANARDAMPTGGTLRIETRTVQNDNAVQVIVADTGQGIAPEIRERVFEPFYSTKEANQGSGLGLATVLGIVNQNDGDIRITSEIDQGTQVTIEFPCTAGINSTTETPTFDTSAKNASGTETILLAEDQEPVRRLIQRAMKDSGYTVLVAKDGVEALSIARDYNGTIDLLVTDLVMPNMGGIELSDALRKLMPELRVIFVSGFTENATPADTVLVGKPYRPSELIRTMREVLDE